MTAVEYLGRHVPRGTAAWRPIPLRMGRADLPGLCRKLGFTRGAEVGVWKGEYSAQFLNQGTWSAWYAVDPWRSYPAWRDPKNQRPPGEARRLLQDALDQATRCLSPFPACTILRTFSLEAALNIPDRSLDLVYLDGNHGYAAVTADLATWIPKIRPGGLIAGHDYRVFAAKPSIEVKAAIDDYTAAHAIDPWFVLTGDRTPSFLWAVS